MCPTTRHTLSGSQSSLIIGTDSPLIVSPDGSLCFVCNDDRMIPGGLQLARLRPDGKRTLVNPELRRLAKEIGGITGVANAPDGSLFIGYPKAVLRVARDGTYSTLVNPVVVPDCDKHPPTGSDVPALRGIVADTTGVIYAAATGCRCVIKITSDKKVATVLKAESPWVPSGVALPAEDLSVLEHIYPNTTVATVDEDWPPRIRRVGRDGKVSTLVTFPREPK